jgi:hypothetical protein
MHSNLVVGKMSNNIWGIAFRMIHNNSVDKGEWFDPENPMDKNTAMAVAQSMNEQFGKGTHWAIRKPNANAAQAPTGLPRTLQ